MGRSVRLVVFGSLGDGLEEKVLELPPSHEFTLWELLEYAGICGSEVQLVMVDHKAVKPTQKVTSGSRVAVFPRDYAIFPDWKDFREGSLPEKPKGAAEFNTAGVQDI